MTRATNRKIALSSKKTNASKEIVMYKKIKSPEVDKKSGVNIETQFCNVT